MARDLAYVQRRDQVAEVTGTMGEGDKLIIIANGEMKPSPIFERTTSDTATVKSAAPPWVKTR